jgi:CRP/FNR family cyclic AMP-dependent transcriptional regulator
VTKVEPPDEHRRARDIASPLLAKGWLSSCRPDFQDDVLAIARVMHVPKGVEVYRAGDIGDAIYGLVSGAVNIEFPADNGELFTLHRSDPGYWIGDLAILAETERLITLSTARDCTFLVLAAADVKRLVETNENALTSLYRLTHENLKLALKLIATLMQKSADKAIAMRLLVHAGEAGEGQWLQITQSELADMTGMSHAKAKQIISKLSKQGLVETAYGKIKVRDIAALAALCRI